MKTISVTPFFICPAPTENTGEMIWINAHHIKAVRGKWIQEKGEYGANGCVIEMKDGTLYETRDTLFNIIDSIHGEFIVE